MKKILIVLAIGYALTAQSQDPAQVVKQCVEAHGGSAWDQTQFVKMHYFSHSNWLEQSERPEGPYLTSYEDVDETHATDQMKLYQKKEYKHFQMARPGVAETVVNGKDGMVRYGKMAMPFPATSGFMDRSLSWLNMAPERLLKQVSNSQLSSRKTIFLNGIAHQVIAFTSPTISGELFIHPNTHLLTEARIKTYWPSEYYFSIWGQFETRIQYSLYALHKGNRFYPHQWDISQNDQPWQQITINHIEFLESTDESLFTIPEDIRARQKKPIKANELKAPLDRIKEIAPGIKLIEESWNTGWAEQSDGIVILEAPISSSYSKSVLEEVKKRYPDKPVKAVIVSSDAWPHLGGAREYMAAQVPIYSSYLNEGILTKLAKADFSPDPDKHHQTNKIPRFAWVQAPQAITDAERPLTIYPVNGEGGERMTVVYFPKQKLLYASDLIQYGDPNHETFFFPEYLFEVQQVIKRYKLDVETVYAMHLEPTPWKKVEDFLNQLK